MWHKLVILASYVFLLSLFLRWIDWCESLIGVPNGLLLEPQRLGVQRLKNILDCRGVLYDSIFEKEHLVDLVESSGQLYRHDLNEADSAVEDYSQPSPPNTDTVGTFAHPAHFYDQVEDSKDTGWIVKIVVPHTFDVINNDLWLRLIAKFRRTDFRFGVLNCRSFARFCGERGWNTTRLILALPLESRSRIYVTLRTFTNPEENHDRHANSPHFDLVRADYTRSSVGHQHVIHKWGHLERWLYQQLAHKVNQLRTTNELSDWLTTACASDVCLLLVSSLTLPPVLLSALSIKFTGRIRFGLANSRTVDTTLDTIANDSETTVRSSAGGRRWANYSRNGQLLVFGPSYFARRQNLTRLVRRPLVYGNIQGERMSFRGLATWLRCLTPDINDIFIFSLALVNMLAGVAVLQNLPGDLRLINTGGQVSLWAVSNPFLKLAVVFAKYNFLLLLGWLVILSAGRFNMFAYFGRQFLLLIREFSLSVMGRHVVCGFQRLCHNGFVCLLTSFVLINAAIQYFTHKVTRQTANSRVPPGINIENPTNNDSDNETFGDWLVSYGRRNPSVSIANLLAMSQPLTNPLDIVFRQGRTRGFFSSGSSDDDTDVGGVQIDEVQHRRILALLAQLEIGVNFLYLRPETVPYDYVFDLPVYKFQPEAIDQQMMGTSETCAICLDAYGPGDDLCCLPCAHGYHHRCIVAWLFRDQPVCPVCRWPANKQKK